MQFEMDCLSKRPSECCTNQRSPYTLTDETDLMPCECEPRINYWIAYSLLLSVDWMMARWHFWWIERCLMTNDRYHESGVSTQRIDVVNDRNQKRRNRSLRLGNPNVLDQCSIISLLPQFLWFANVDSLYKINSNRLWCVCCRRHSAKSSISVKSKSMRTQFAFGNCHTWMSSILSS